MVSKRQNLKLRVIREVALWSLVAYDLQSATTSLNPFTLLELNHKTWRQDLELWRKVMGEIKPKERAIKIWKNENKFAIVQRDELAFRMIPN